MWALRFGMQLLVANKIPVSQYGQVSLVTVIVTGLMLLSDIGITPNVVQSRRGDDPDFLDTAYSVSVVRGVGLWLIAAVLAYPVGHFYGDPALIGMLAIAASATCIRGFSSSSLWTMTRHVQVHKLTVLNVVSEVVGFLVALVWVLRDPSAWALIAATVAAAITFTTGSFFMGRRPQLRWVPTAAHELIRFGFWLFLSTATYFAASQAERLALGRFVTPDQLGWFSMAVTMAAAPTRAIQQLFEQVFFPLIARLCRDDPDRAILQFRRTKLIAFALALGAAAVCILGGPLAVKLLLKPEYKPAGPMLQLLGFRAAVEILTGPTVNMLFAAGQSRFAATGNLLRLAVMIPGLWIALRYFSIDEAIWVLTLAPFAAYLATLHAIYRHVRAGFAVECWTMVGLVVFGGTMGLLHKFIL